LTPAGLKSPKGPALGYFSVGSPGPRSPLKKP
jgi:hypothetical protein